MIAFGLTLCGVNQSRLVVIFALLHIVCCDAQSVTNTKNFIKIESSPANVYSMADTIIINLNGTPVGLKILEIKDYSPNVKRSTRIKAMISFIK